MTRPVASPEDRLAGQARQAVAAAVREGRLERKPCVICGSERSEAHHTSGYDPEHWLDVVWLCGIHHSLVHGRHRPPGATHRWSSVKLGMGQALQLHEIRSRRSVSQAEMARRMGKAQPAISAIEHRRELFVSTLRAYIEALGGTLEITATFDAEQVPVKIGSSEAA